MNVQLLFVGLLLVGIQARAQNLMLLGASPSYSQMGKLSNKWAYSLNATSVIDVFDQTIEGKLFPATHTHFVVQGLGVYQINKQ
jgi:hypothetical protein